VLSLNEELPEKLLIWMLNGSSKMNWKRAEIWKWWKIPPCNDVSHNLCNFLTDVNSNMMRVNQEK
jgi:hypothetical protein